MIQLLLVLVLISLSLTYTRAESEYNYNQVPSNDECVHRIYSECNYPTHFTDEELENVRQFLNYSFTVLADIKPDKPLCPKLHVRHDWKCLSQQQKERLINVWKEMYKTGDVQRLTDLHYKTWPAWHKSGELLSSHRWLTTEFERLMQLIDPGATLPYWDPYTYGVQPERSSVWEMLGHSGNYSNGYTVTDGLYAHMDLVPTVKRHWSPDGTILPWFTQEFITFAIQSSVSYPDITLKAIGVHFIPHLNIGGYEGQYSQRTAPYDMLFYMQHITNVDVELIRWQLQREDFLTPLSYDLSKVYSHFDGTPIDSDIRTDTLTGVPWVTIREPFWIGFGDYCFIPDQLVRPISNKWKGIADPIPTAAKRLPKHIIEKYFMAFNSGNFSAISHTLEEVGECNPHCLPIPKPTFMRDTEQGRRQFQAHRFDVGVDLKPNIERIEQLYIDFWSDLTESGYCSPYVTTY